MAVALDAFRKRVCFPLKSKRITSKPERAGGAQFGVRSTDSLRNKSVSLPAPATKEISARSKTIESSPLPAMTTSEPFDPSKVSDALEPTR